MKKLLILLLLLFACTEVDSELTAEYNNLQQKLSYDINQLNQFSNIDPNNLEELQDKSSAYIAAAEQMLEDLKDYRAFIQRNKQAIDDGFLNADISADEEIKWATKGIEEMERIVVTLKQADSALPLAVELESLYTNIEATIAQLNADVEVLNVAVEDTNTDLTAYVDALIEAGNDFASHFETYIIQEKALVTFLDTHERALIDASVDVPLLKSDLQKTTTQITSAKDSIKADIDTALDEYTDLDTNRLSKLTSLSTTLGNFR